MDQHTYDHISVADLESALGDQVAPIGGGTNPEDIGEIRDQMTRMQSVMTAMMQQMQQQQQPAHPPGIAASSGLFSEEQRQQALGPQSGLLHPSLSPFASPPPGIEVAPQWPASLQQQQQQYAESQQQQQQQQQNHLLLQQLAE